MKAKIIVKDNYELPELTYEFDGEMKGGFTLLESPAEVRTYIIETSPKIISEIMDDPRYEFVEEIEEV